MKPAVNSTASKQRPVEYECDEANSQVCASRQLQGVLGRVRKIARPGELKPGLLNFLPH